MSHRPYPNAERALRQLGRHHVPEPVPQRMNVSMAAALAGFSELAEALKASAWRPHALYDPKTDQFAVLSS